MSTTLKEEPDIWTIGFSEYSGESSSPLHSANRGNLAENDYNDGIPEFEKRVYKLIDNQPETPPSQPIITDDVNEDLKDLLDKKKKQKKQENQPPPPPTNDIIVPPENGDIIQLDKNKFGLVESVVDGKIRFRTLTKKQAATILNERAKG